MQVPEALYSFTRSQDMVSQHFECLRKTAAFSIGAGAQSATVKLYSVPNDRALFLNAATAMVAVFGDANVILRELSVAMTDVGEAFSLASIISAAPASTRVGTGASGNFMALGFAPNVIIPGGHDIYLTVGTNLATAAGQAGYFSIYGVSVPRGNILSA